MCFAILDFFIQWIFSALLYERVINFLIIHDTCPRYLLAYLFTIIQMKTPTQLLTNADTHFWVGAKIIYPIVWLLNYKSLQQSVL